jgi:type IV secretory pathway VirB10-like protein
LLVVAAVGFLAALAVADALRSGQPSSAPTTESPTTTSPTPPPPPPDAIPTLPTPPPPPEEIPPPLPDVVPPPPLPDVVPSSPTARQQIERNGNAWARAFATGRPRRDQSCRYQTQPLCERNACVRVGGFKIRNCSPPTRAFRHSFLNATVEEIVIKGNRAAARFSNGEVVEFDGAGDTWWVHRLGRNAGHGFFE